MVPVPEIKEVSYHGASRVVFLSSVTALLIPWRWQRGGFQISFSLPAFFLCLESICGLWETLWEETPENPKFCSSSLCNLYTEDLWIKFANLVHCSTVPSQISSTDKCLTSWFRRFFNPSIDSFLGYAFWLSNNIQATLFVL